MKCLSERPEGYLKMGCALFDFIMVVDSGSNKGYLKNLLNAAICVSDFKHGLADGLPGRAHKRGVAVVGEEEGKFAYFQIKPCFRRAAEKFDVALFVIALSVLQAAAVYPAVGFPAV